MPKFLFSVVFGCLIGWVLIILLLNLTTPNIWLVTLILLPLLFATVTLTISLTLFFLSARNYKKFRLFNEKKHFRTCLKWGSFYSIGLTALLLLRAIHFFNIGTFLVCIILYAGLYIFMRNKVPSIW